jgi:hypothetical protein
MADYWYCCQCGDGANNSMTTACPMDNCRHRRCGCCTSTYNSSYTYTSYSPNVPDPIAASPSYSLGHKDHHHELAYNAPRSPCSNSTVALANTFQVSAYTGPNTYHAATILNGSTFPDANNTTYGQPPERKPVWRWICCNCGFDNSYKTDQGCVNCHNHWRDDKCTVYNANAR